MTTTPGHKQPDYFQPRAKMATTILSIAFLLVTLAIYFVYRVIFIQLISPGTTHDDAMLIYLYGMRLDAALVAIELAVVTILFLLTRYFRLRAFASIIVALTFIHLLLAFSNLLFITERDQHLWEMFLANITSPEEILIAISPFLQLHLVLISTSILAAIVFSYFSHKATRHLPHTKLDLWKPRPRFRHALLLILLLSLSTLDPLAHPVKKHWSLGWIPYPTTSQFYMNFDGYQANQAVVNPLHDFVRFYLPATLTGMSSDKVDRIDRIEALSLSKELLGNNSLNENYPLLHKLEQKPELGLKNVIIIQVEGLSQSIIGRQQEGLEITPFLNQLSKKGLYFDNVVQSFNATDGAVFSTTTGVHKAFFNQNWKYFLPVEVNGYFGSLPHLLGSDSYGHFSMHAFHNRREVFSSFMRNQGYESVDYLDFEKRLGGEEVMPEYSNALGIFDGIFLREAADILADIETPFTAHLITATTHSPWQVPDDAATPFKNKRTNSFHYLDQSIEAFIKAFREKSPSFEDTLFVIVADHTSVLYGKGMMERIRVPLFFYSPALEAMNTEWQQHPDHYESQVDIIPTILQLIDGDHNYSGLGNSLLSQNKPNAGAISSNRYESLYLKDNYVLRYSPFASAGEETQLFAIRDDEIIENDISNKYQDIVERLKREYFSLYETSSRLTSETSVSLIS
ncbi:LTA synthase family protein [Solemya elarraichensis gill symbiont]|uniref:Sulfatase N-terminal domain-containing protein n=1 Tax=Solemya elarraichensis gill symbiont TaxID=1918949 RepID=A0A1T2LBX1_9GAMM|nr:LTA synthase family protein [Solemya elarraichensis gill symbiont]OOZ42597.1 hypothetical protein BOW52_02370 [Solemya elarraichensis gill symbiont]